MPRYAFGVAASVDEDECRAMLEDQLRQSIVDLQPHIARHYRFEWRERDLELQVAGADMTGVDDGAVGASVSVNLAGPNQEAGYLLDGLLSGGQANTSQ